MAPRPLPSRRTPLSDTTVGVSAKLTLFSDGGKTDYPVITADPAQICTSTKFYDVNGNLRQGTKGCEADIPACEEDGDHNTPDLRNIHAYLLTILTDDAAA